MAVKVASGQRTFVDHNDAKTLTGIITATYYSQDVTDLVTDVFSPDFTSANNTFTAKVYAGTVDITNQLVNKKWGTTFGGSDLGSQAVAGAAGTTYVKNTNLTAGSFTAFFYAEWTDPDTGLLIKINLEKTITRNVLGSNAVYVRLEGVDVIQAAVGVTKNYAYLSANLIDAGSPAADADLTFKWWVLEAGAWKEIFTGAGGATGAAANFGYRTKAQVSAATFVAAGAGSYATSGFGDRKGIQIWEAGVVDYGYFKVEVTYAKDGKVYTGFATVFDISDPYDTDVISTAGNIFQNGLGQTQLTPTVKCGSVVYTSTDLAAWIFYLSLKDRNGLPAGIINQAKSPYAEGGKSVTANDGTTLTLSGVFTTVPVAGEVIKVVKPDGSVKYAELSAVTNTTNAVLTIKTASFTTTWITSGQANFIAAAMTASDFVGAKVFVLRNDEAGKQGVGKLTGIGTPLDLSGYDIDVKGDILIDAWRP